MISKTFGRNVGDCILTVIDETGLVLNFWL